MNLTKKQKVMLAAMGLGVAALAADKLVFGPPGEASADQSAPTEAVPLDDAAQANAPAAPGTPTTSVVSGARIPAFAGLTRRLDELDAAGAQPPTDPFRLPADWAHADPSDIISRSQQDTSDEAQRLLEQYKLKGILTTGKRSRAVLIVSAKQETTIVYIGQTFYPEPAEPGQLQKGYRLIQINSQDSQGAVWEVVSSDQSAVNGKPIVMPMAVDPL